MRAQEIDDKIASGILTVVHKSEVPPDQQPYQQYGRCNEMQCTYRRGQDKHSRVEQCQVQNKTPEH
jgi:hypothetical protein